MSKPRAEPRAESSENPRRPAEVESPNRTPLEPRLERLRALRSAFGALAPSAVSVAGREIAEAGRELTQRLARAKREAGALPPIALAQIDTSLEAFESKMRQLACGLAVAQLRSTIPGRLGNDRRSVLDLLDLFLGEGIEIPAELSSRIGSIDYLITLLCTHGARRPGVVAHDPTSLSARIAALCARADSVDDPGLAEIETEFFAAASMESDRAREEIQRRTQRQRKVDLGGVFFAPRVLRAIVTYNAAQLERVTDAILDAGDWGVVDSDSTAGASPEAAGGSLFESLPFGRIATAVRQRVRGDEAPDSPETRIAMALELDVLDPSELESLVQESVGSPEDPIGTAILVGLLCRSLALLSIELQSLGLSPDGVSDAWVAELDGRFRREIDDKLANNAYKQACALTELKNKFLFAPLAERLREEHVLAHPAVRRQKPSTETVAALEDAKAALAPATPEGDARVRSRVPPTAIEKPTATSRPAQADRRERARDLVREALDEDRRGRKQQAAALLGRGSAISLARIAQAAILLVAVAAGLHLYLGRSERDLHDFSREQLGLISPYLVEGRRNGEGRGPGFVGTLDDRWKSLPHDSRQTAAETLVLRLREHGLEQVMVYDRDRALRIQSIGSQPIRTL